MQALCIPRIGDCHRSLNPFISEKYPVILDATRTRAQLIFAQLIARGSWLRDEICRVPAYGTRGRKQS